jgi:hypothetical protein
MIALHLVIYCAIRKHNGQYWGRIANCFINNVTESSQKMNRCLINNVTEAKGGGGGYYEGRSRYDSTAFFRMIRAATVRESELFPLVGKGSAC